MKDKDEDLWVQATGDVKPLKPAPRKRPKQPAAPKLIIPIAEVRPVRKAARGHELDRRTEERLQKGEMKIEARIDLHGYRLAQAERALRDFIMQTYTQRMRCVLVITGKGQRPPIDDADWFVGAHPRPIRDHAPAWLSAPAIAPLILRICPAQAKHGGAGALYVLLRRQPKRH